MIRDLSMTLKALLEQSGLPKELNDAVVSFDRPSDQFSPDKTTVDLFLYDVKENVELRSNEPIVGRYNGQVSIRRPPLRVACSYLVTAWPVGGTELILQEHRLLSQTLQVLSRYPTIPALFLQGALAGQEPPLPMITAQAEGLKNPAEFWTAIGGKMRPSLSVSVTIAMDIFAPLTPPLVTTGDIRFGERSSAAENELIPETGEEFFRIGGRITDAGNAPAAGARVTLVESGQAAVTDSNGLYRLGPVKAGTFTVRVQAGAAPPEDFPLSVPALYGTSYDIKLP
jgi:hypothetical protein